MGQIFADKIGNNNKLLDFDSLQTNRDASESDEVVRLSQAQSIAAAAGQAIITSVLGAAESTNTFSAEYLANALDSKQDNLSVDSSYFTLVNNTLGLKDLGRISGIKISGQPTLADFIASSTFNGDGTITHGSHTIDAMTFIFLSSATLPSEAAHVYLGTNNGNADDFGTFSIDYNQGVIRTFLSATGTGVSYNSGTGSFALDLGTNAAQLGAHSLPINAALFPTGTISNFSDVSSMGVKLAEFIKAVDTSGANGTATLESTIRTILGLSTGTTYSAYGSLISAGKNQNQINSEIVSAVETANSDRTAIRNEAAARATIVDSNLAAEVLAREAAVSAEISARQSGDASLQTGLNALSANLTAETARAQNAEASNNATILQEVTDRQDAVTAEATARSSADATESAARSAADTNLQNQINALAGSNIELVGTVGSDGVFDAVEADSRNGENFVDIAMSAGEVVLIDSAVTLLGQDFKNGDQLMVKVASITAGAMQFSDFAYRKGDETDLTRANLGSSTVDLDGNDDLRVTPDSIGRTELAASVEADIDDKVSLTTDSQTITAKNIQVDQSDDELGSSFGLYLKKTQTGSGALTGTCRALLVENWVNSNGSSNSAIPAYAHNTIASHYDGACTDLSMVLSGLYAEANAKAGTAINAIGSYSVSTDTQNGINIGAVAMAENAGISNIAQLGYASTDGAGADRAAVAALTSQSLALYSATRVADPFPYDEIALVADAKYAPAGSKAFYAYGDCVLEGGTVSVPSASTDASAVNLGDIKAKEKILRFDLSSGSKTVQTNMDLTKVKPVGDGQVKHNVSGVTVSVAENGNAGELVFTATGTNVSQLTSVLVYLYEMSCDITDV